MRARSCRRPNDDRPVGSSTVSSASHTKLPGRRSIAATTSGNDLFKGLPLRDSNSTRLPTFRTRQRNPSYFSSKIQFSRENGAGCGVASIKSSELMTGMMFMDSSPSTHECKALPRRCQGHSPYSCKSARSRRAPYGLPRSFEACGHQGFSSKTRTDRRSISLRLRSFFYLDFGGTEADLFDKFLDFLRRLAGGKNEFRRAD